MSKKVGIILTSIGIIFLIIALIFYINVLNMRFYSLDRFIYNILIITFINIGAEITHIGFFISLKRKITVLTYLLICIGLVSILNYFIVDIGFCTDFICINFLFAYYRIFSFFGIIFLVGLIFYIIGIILAIRSEKIRVKSAEKRAKKVTKKDKIDASRIQKLSKLLKISDRIKIDDISDVLKMKRGILLDQLIDWSDKLEFKLDGDFLIINQSSVDDFINALDKQFSTWERREGSQDGKI